MVLSRILVRCAIAIVASIAALTATAAPRRAIPDDELGLAALITLKNGSTGSGFYFHTEGAVYLVTAKHVLFEIPGSGKLRDTSLTVLSYPRDPHESSKIRYLLDLSALDMTGEIYAHTTEDVAAIKIGTIVDTSRPVDAGPTAPTSATAGTTGQQRRQFNFVPGVSVIEASDSGLVSVGPEGVDKLDQVLVGNEIRMFGYPTSLSLVPNPKIDFQRPLLRKGIIAGTNESAHSIILDCPAYQGDSGGPIVEIYVENPFETHFRVIGVVSQFVPFADTWLNQHFGYTNTTLENSGYSIAVPMDFVLELVK